MHFGRKMVRSAVNNAFLSTLTMETPFPRVSLRSGSCSDVTAIRHDFVGCQCSGNKVLWNRGLLTFFSARSLFSSADRLHDGSAPAVAINRSQYYMHYYHYAKPATSQFSDHRLISCVVFTHHAQYRPTDAVPFRKHETKKMNYCAHF